MADFILRVTTPDKLPTHALEVNGMFKEFLINTICSHQYTNNTGHMITERQDFLVFLQDVLYVQTNKTCT